MYHWQEMRLNANRYITDWNYSVVLYYVVRTRVLDDEVAEQEDEECTVGVDRKIGGSDVNRGRGALKGRARHALFGYIDIR